MTGAAPVMQRLATPISRPKRTNRNPPRFGRGETLTGLSAFRKSKSLPKRQKWGASPTTHLRSPAKSHPLDFGGLRQRKRIINVYNQVPYRVLDFAMAKQNLDRSEIAL